MSTRVRAIDLGRGIAVLSMMVVHSLWMYGDPVAQTSTWFGRVVHLVGRGTPMFLLAMGFSHVCSIDRGSLDAARRGTRTLAIGYAMNAMKFVVPIVVFRTMPSSFIDAYGFDAPLGTAELGYLVRTGDILQLAGVCLFAMGPIRTHIQNPSALFALAVGVAVSSNLVRGITTGIGPVDLGLDLLWGDSYSVYFPVFPWFSMILVGMAFGRLHQRRGSDDATTFGAMGAFGVVATLSGGALCHFAPASQFRDFFHLGPGGALFVGGGACIAYWLVHRLRGPLGTGRIGALFDYCSTHVTSLYVISWVLICWGMGIVGYQTRSIPEVIGLSLVVVLLTFGVHRAIERAKTWCGERSPGQSSVFDPSRYSSS